MFAVPINDPSSVMKVADWIELYVILEESVSKAEVSSFITHYGNEEPKEEFIDNIWQEMEDRAFLYGDSPPFKVLSRRVDSQIEWEKNPEYLMFILLAILGNAYLPTATGKLFERLACEAIRNYLGGEALVYGFPSKQRVKDLAKALNEEFIRQPTTNFKDRGLDVIAWVPFCDDRCSQTVIMFQCAAGHNWTDKLGDLPWDAWVNYINWGCKPLRGFVFPHILSEDLFIEHSYKGGLLIDRPRLYRYTNSMELGELRPAIKDWCIEKLPILEEIG